MFDTSPQPLDVRSLIGEFCPPGSRTFDILMRHGDLVAEKALAAANRVAHLKPDREFLLEAAYLHDIGIMGTHTPELGCQGTDPYLRHGVIGRGMLEAAGMPRHALVCERHVGVGITAEEIRNRRLPLPERDMAPVSLEEQIVCYADKFFSKDGQRIAVKRTAKDVRNHLARFGPHQVAIFDRWHSTFG
ncbi:MAG: HD domain-containing protein [Desulfobacterales bacterium]